MIEHAPKAVKFRIKRFIGSRFAQLVGILLSNTSKSKKKREVLHRDYRASCENKSCDTKSPDESTWAEFADRFAKNLSGPSVWS